LTTASLLLEGQYGDDLLVGGTGGDTLNGGPGADEVDARDGLRDVIDLTGSGSGDVVYYDRGIDEFVTSSAQSASAAEAARATGAELSSATPPEGLFAHTGKVLVEHEGKELLVAEKQVERHTAHGDEIIDPTGRAGEEGGSR
jgi:Ca2+-binding RTX toxin-like protein